MKIFQNEDENLETEVTFKNDWDFVPAKGLHVPSERIIDLKSPIFSSCSSMVSPVSLK